MSTNSEFEVENSSGEVVALVRKLYETLHQIKELTGGEVDAVVSPGGQSYLLQEAQEKLRQTETVQRQLAATMVAIIDALPAHIALIDAQGLLISVNNKWRQFATDTELQGSKFEVGQNYIEICERAIGQCSIQGHHAAKGIRRVLSGSISRFTLEYPCRSVGEERWFEMTILPVSDGGPDGAVIMHIDITDRKQSEKALRTSEENFRNTSEQLAKILDSSPDVICAFNSEGCFVQVSAACESVWGYTPQELIGTPYIDKVLAEDHPKSIEAASVIMQGQSTRSFENRYVRKDGLVANIIWSASWSQADQTMYCVARDQTEVIKANAALKESQSRYRSLFENMLEGYAYCRVLFDEGLPNDLLYLEVNDAFGKLTGLADVVGKKMSVVIPGIFTTNPDLLAAYVRVASTGTTEKRLEYIVPLALWLEISIYSQEKDHFIAVFENVTKRQQIEKETRFNELRYRSLVEATSQIVWNTPASGEFTVEQPSWTAFTGQSFEELRGWGWLNAVHPDDRMETDRLWSKAVISKSPYVLEHRLRSHDNSYRNMSVRAFPILDEDKTIHEWIGVHKDITERKLSEQHIKEQAELLDKTRDAITVRDLQGTILFWNKGAERMYGSTSSEAVGRNAVDILQINPERFQEVSASTLQKGEWNGELRHVSATGRKLVVEARWTLVCDHEGAPKSILAIDTDITEKKQIENQFLRAQRMESIGTLAGGVAHDLNNILAPILMSIQILKLTARDLETTDILNTIEKSAKRGADIVRQVLSFARGLESQRTEVTIKDLVDEIENIIRGTFPKNIQVEVSVSNGVWTIDGDSTQIHQIILNLCVNARDAMPNGGTLKISVENGVLDENYSAMNLQAKPGRYVIISVADSGVGMSQQIIDKIFDPFFTTKELSKGTGLGLSTVMAVIKSHEGLINVYSEPGRGSTFKVYLPAMESSSNTSRADDVLSLPCGNGETVLVIDDETSILTITGQTLHAFGYKSMIALDGAEGVAIYAQNVSEIAVVVTDMNMPIMSGIATIRALMRINPMVKVIAASGLNVDGDADKLKDLGVIHSLAKPYTAEALLTTLRRVLDPPPGI